MTEGYWIPPLEALLARSPQKGALAALRLGDKTFDDFLVLSGREVQTKVFQYAEFLKDLGLGQGDRIAIKGYNGIEWVALDWAAMISGIVTVPLYGASVDSEVNHILREAQVRVLFVDETHDAYECRQVSFEELESRASLLSGNYRPTKAVRPEMLATLIYTSGTQGRPKGVMHSFGNLCEALLRANEVVNIGSRDRMISYLPLSHVAERMLIDVASLYTSAEVYFIDKVERMVSQLPHVRPTLFLAVPRIWDMLKFKLEKELKSNPVIQRRLARVPAVMRPWIVRRSIRRKMGLDRCRLVFSGAAKLGSQTAAQLKEWGLSVHECYGLTETLCVSTMTRPDQIVFDSCGQLYHGVQARIAEDGEILLKAPFHFEGYYEQPEATAEALQEGWFHTGDVGHFDPEGNLFITDRKKNLFKNSGGKYVAPLVAETLLKNFPAVREAIVLGENRPNCVALINWDSSLGTLKELEAHLDFVNQKLAPHEQIKKVAYCEEVWSASTGELTASLKLKKRVILEKYSAEIEALYNAKAKLMSIDELTEGMQKRAHTSF